MAALTERDTAMLAFERQTWQHAGAKENAIRELFDCRATRYYQELNALLDRPEAPVHDGPTVNRLLRLREQRRGRRTAVL